jgi:hypothetical protein
MVLQFLEEGSPEGQAPQRHSGAVEGQSVFDWRENGQGRFQGERRKGFGGGRRGGVWAV